MAKWKEFEDFWENSGILETDDFYDLCNKYGFTKDNVPDSLKGLIRSVWALSGIDGYNAGRKSGMEECDESWKSLLDIAAIAFRANDQKVSDGIINILKNK